MPAPEEISAMLESILGIFLSDIRHRERAAFILCDDLIEMSCKTKARQRDYTFDTACNFYNAWNAPGVRLAPNGLGRRVQDRRNTRNNMQHADAAITVETPHCAEAILDAVNVIDKCWTDTSRNRFDLWVKCALRIVQLYSTRGNLLKREPFEDAMLKMNWRGENRATVRSNENQIEPGRRVFWWLTIINHTQLVEKCLNDLEIP
jgi:hypothetical protein